MTIVETLSPEQRRLVEQHLNLVIAANENVNLTRIDTFEEGMLLHVEDSLAALAEMNETPDGLYGDLGSGGGFPGVPLAIATGRKAMLIDSRQKKMAMLDGIIDEMGITDQVCTFAGRAELLARSKPECFSVITARALAKLPVLLELASPLLIRGGHLICYKAQVEDSELADALRVAPLTGMKCLTDRTFTLGGNYTRRIIVYVKSSKPKVKLPRQEGQAQKQPL